jgi:DNA-binding NarL/FixJ family response regulator
MRVLVVDDDPGTCENLTIGLRAFGGHDVIAAQNVASGIAKAHAQRFHAGFIDLHFPEGSGLDALRAFVCAQPRAHAFLMSAYEEQEDVVEALALGAVFVPKWIDVEHLALILSRTHASRVPEPPDHFDPDFCTARVRSTPKDAEESWAELVLRGLLSGDDPRTLEIWCRAAGVSRTVLEERHADAGIRAYDAKCLTRLLWAIKAAQACGARPIDMLKADPRTAGQLLGRFATTNAIPLRIALESQTFVTNPAAMAALARRLSNVSVFFDLRR